MVLERKYKPEGVSVTDTVLDYLRKVYRFFYITINLFI